MKKTYFAPLAKTIDIESEVLIANSNLENGEDITPGEKISGDSNRRRNSIWGDSEW